MMCRLFRLPSALPPKREARRYVANDFLNLIALPQWGRLRYEDTAFLDTTPFQRGESKEEAASPPKKEANPASLRSAAPSKGRGSRGYSLLPLEGGAPKGRRLDGDSGMKESEEMHLKSTINESTLSTADAVPLPQWVMR